jgi:(4S)-4-hydroxy-5-phosphonooxypentane-2,3-dione isomerase
MYIVHVFVHVKPEYVKAFVAATIENARNSVKEPGIARFDVIQQADDPTRFVLIEVYRTPDDPAKHKETAHYNQWREVCEPLLAEPRTRIVYGNVFPHDQDWKATDCTD